MRILAKEEGLIVSISFASVTRLRWLESICETNAWWLHVHVVEHNHPSDSCHGSGSDFRFVSVMGRRESGSKYRACTPSEFSKCLLDRARQTGSLLDDGEISYGPSPKSPSLEPCSEPDDSSASLEIGNASDDDEEGRSTNPMCPRMNSTHASQAKT